MQPVLDLSFNRIASAYDAQRAHPPQVAAEVGRAIVALLSQGATVLELGVGTGRIALPVAQAGAQVVGLDLAGEMLRIAQAKWPPAKHGATPGDLALVQADMLRLPFATARFAAVLAVHVLHLAPDWRAALAEVARVLCPGGLFIQGNDWRDPESCVGLLRGQLRQVVLELLPGARPPGAGAAVAQALSRLGGYTAAPLTVARWSQLLSPAAVLEGMAARIDAETWALPDAVLIPAIEQVREWAHTQWPDLTVEQPVEHRFVLTITQFAGATAVV